MIASICCIAGLSQLPLTAASFSRSTTNGGNALATAAAFCASPGSVSVAMVHDTMVEQDQPTANFASSNPIDVQARTGQARRTYLAWDSPVLPSRCSITAASLMLRATSVAAGRTYDLYRLSGLWSYDTLTWATQPVAAGTPASATPTAPTTTFNVTALVVEMYQSGNYGFMVRDRTEGTAATFVSHFSAINGSNPSTVLTLTWG